MHVLHENLESFIRSVNRNHHSNTHSNIRLALVLLNVVTFNDHHCKNYIPGESERIPWNRFCCQTLSKKIIWSFHNSCPKLLSTTNTKTVKLDQILEAGSHMSNNDVHKFLTPTVIRRNAIEALNFKKCKHTAGFSKKQLADLIYNVNWKEQECSSMPSTIGVNCCWYSDEINSKRHNLKTKSKEVVLNISKLVFTRNAKHVSPNRTE